MKNLLGIKLPVIAGLILLTSTATMAKEEGMSPIGIHYDRAGNQVNSVKALVDSETGIGGTSIRYISYAASGMNGNYNDDRSYSGGGCMSANTGLLDLQAAIDLPSGSRIVSVTFNVIDSSDSEFVNGALIEFENDGSQTSLLDDTTTNADIPGAINLGGFLDYVVNPGSGPNATWVMGRLESVGNAVELCGIRIGFIPPSVASDVIFVTNFYR